MNNSTFEIGVELDNISANNGATEKLLLSYSDDNNELSAEYNNAVTFKAKYLIRFLIASEYSWKH